MQKDFNLIAQVILLVYLSVELFTICRKIINQAKYTVPRSEKIEPSAISGIDCLIVGKHPFRGNYGRVVGSNESRGRWALVISLKDRPGIYCYVFENQNLQFL